eukprot:1136155_1
MKRVKHFMQSSHAAIVNLYGHNACSGFIIHSTHNPLSGHPMLAHSCSPHWVDVFLFLVQCFLVRSACCLCSSSGAHFHCRSLLCAWSINKLLQDLNKILKVSDILQFKVHHDFKSKPTHATHNTARTEHFGSRSVYANTGDILMGPFTYKPWLFGEYAMFCSTNLSLIMTKTKQHDMSDVRIDITDKEMILSKHHNSFMTILKNIPLSKGKGYNIMTICGVFLNHKEQQSMMNIL